MADFFTKKTSMADDIKRFQKTIMIAEDNPKTRLVLEKTLSAAGYKVVSVANGKEARDYLENSMPNLLILDMKMPEIHGSEVIRFLIKKKHTVPVLVYTGYPEMREGVTVISYKYCDYLAKPASRDEILAKVKEMTSTDSSQS